MKRLVGGEFVVGKIILGIMLILTTFIAWRTWQDRVVEAEIKTKTGDRWRGGDMQTWARKLAEDNPSIKVPPVKPMVGNNGQQVPEP